MNRAILAAAVDRLGAAGIDSARVEVEILAAYVLGVDRGRLVVADDMTSAQRTEFDELLDRRASREPLQHIVGTAPFGPLDLEVGPGVFIPRPETELILEWAVRACESVAHPRVVDLCSGSGALAIATATMVPDARVIAVENDPDALIWLRRNVSRCSQDVGRRLTVVEGDVRDASLLEPASADVVVSNPPYVPDGTPISPEVATHDPSVAVFGGPDGMSVMTPMIELIARILVPGGPVAIEHDDLTADLVVDDLRRRGTFDSVEAHRDLTGRPRFVTARRRTGDAVDAPVTGAVRR